MQRTAREVERIGFTPELFWNFPTPYTKFLHRHLSGNAGNPVRRNPVFINSGYGHYAIVRTAYELGCESTFIVEDDCRFVKDKDRLLRELSQIPEDADLVLLDSFRPLAIPLKDFLASRRPVVGCWAQVDRVRSAAAYLVNRRCMGRIISCIDAGASGAKVRAFDQWFDKDRLRGLNIYCAVPSLAIQQDPPSVQLPRQTKGATKETRYAGMSLNFNDYAAW